MIGKLKTRTVEATNRRAVRLINSAARPTHTITADNGTEFHGYGAIEAETGSKFYFADALSFLGTRHQREHQRTDSSVPTEASEHGSRHPTPLLSHRPNAQQQTS